jgi:hypothetical protein
LRADGSSNERRPSEHDRAVTAVCAEPRSASTTFEATSHRMNDAIGSSEQRRRWQFGLATRSR